MDVHGFSDPVKVPQQEVDFAAKFGGGTSDDYGHNPPPDRHTRAAVNFFREHAGYQVGHRIAGALALARAERCAKEKGWVTVWVPDEDPDLSWMDDDERRQDHDVEIASLRDPSGTSPRCQGRHNVIASLGGIVDADRHYRRVVEAELALEAGACDDDQGSGGE